jgi:hypothetical protein
MLDRKMMHELGQGCIDCASLEHSSSTLEFAVAVLVKKPSEENLAPTNSDAGSISVKNFEATCRALSSRARHDCQNSVSVVYRGSARNDPSAGTAEALNTRCTSLACSDQMSIGDRHRASRPGNSA